MRVCRAKRASSRNLVEAGYCSILPWSCSRVHRWQPPRPKDSCNSSPNRERWLAAAWLFSFRYGDLMNVSHRLWASLDGPCRYHPEFTPKPFSTRFYPREVAVR